MLEAPRRFNAETRNPGSRNCEGPLALEVLDDLGQQAAKLNRFGVSHAARGLAIDLSAWHPRHFVNLNNASI